MSLATVNGVEVVEGTITLPRTGAWHADLTLDAQDTSQLTGAATIVLNDAALASSFTGTILPSRSGAQRQMASVRVVGGAGGLGLTAKPKAYSSQTGSLTLAQPLGDLLSTAGETLSATVSKTLLGTPLANWWVLGLPISGQLLVLIDTAAPGASWRMLTDGTVWIGAETWPALTADYDFMGSAPHEGFLELASLTAPIIPGVTINDGAVDHVVYVIEEGKLRCRVWTA